MENSLSGGMKGLSLSLDGRILRSDPHTNVAFATHQHGQQLAFGMIVPVQGKEVCELVVFFPLFFLVLLSLLLSSLLLLSPLSSLSFLLH